MKKEKLSHLFYIGTICCLVILFLTGCFGKYDFNFDVADDETNLLSRAAESDGINLLSRTAEPIESAPFCQFSKYEITIYYVHIIFYSEYRGRDYHTIINRDIENGIKVDLVNEKLSNKIPEEDLLIINAVSNAVESILIGIGDTITVNGYVYRNGELYHTTSSGFVAGEETPEDLNLPVEGGTLIPTNNEEPNDPPIIEGLNGVDLLLAYGGHNIGSDDVTLNDMGTLEFRFPTDIGIRYRGWDMWESANISAGTPYIEESTIYEKYYLRRVGEPYYTDMIRFLFDKNGHLIPDQVCGYPFDFSANNVFNYYDPLRVWLNFNGNSKPTLEEYNQALGINSDGTIYFDSRNGRGNGNVYAPAFVRDSHTGIMTVQGEEVTYEAIKVE